ncbi:MAG: molybdopterin-dependent oxidoreductase [Actinobacteria bacterium]|nr:molybdopterin-dependent oxidoreductase [Actinomycetota bacterium]
MGARLRAGRGTNLAILALLSGALVTGTLATAIGGGWSRWAVIAHGVIGLTLVAIAPWKSVISRRGIRRRGPRAAPSLVLAFLIVFALAAGIAHAAGVGEVWFLPVRALWLHVAAALCAIPLAIWHVTARRTFPRRTDLSRRSLVRGGAALAVGSAAYVAYEGAVGVLGLSGDRRRYTGSHEAGSFDPSEMPTTIWLDDSRPSIDAAKHMVTVATSADRRDWSVSELAGFGHDLRATLDCTSGWYATQDWTGVLLDQLLGEVDGRSVMVRSVTGYSRRFPLGDAPNILLATHYGGVPLEAGHGAPVRLVAPGRRGFWWVKWVESIAVEDTPWWWQPPFPLT